MPVPAVKPAATSGNRHQRRAAAARGVVSPFAASFGLEAPKETDDEKKSRRAADRAKKDGESDEDYAKRCAELDDKEKAEDDKEKKEAEDPEKDPDLAADDEEKEAAAFAAGFTAGGQRWQDVLTAKEAKGKGLIACHLLSSTDMSAKDITTALVAMQPDAQANSVKGLAARMAAENPEPPKPGDAPGQSTKSGMITPEAIMQAAAAARGEKPATK